MHNPQSENFDNTGKLFAAGLIPSLLALYLIITSGWNVLPSFDSYDSKRLIELGLIIISLLFGLAYRPVRKRAAKLFTSVPLAVQLLLFSLFLLGIASAIASEHTFYGLTEVSLYFSLLVLVFFTAASAQIIEGRMLQLMAVFLLALGTLVSITELIGLLVSWNHGQPADSHMLFMRFSHPRFFNQVQSWLLPLMILPLLVFEEKKWLRAIAWFNQAFWWALLIYSGGRGSLLGLACAYAFVFLLLFRNPHLSRWRNMQFFVFLSGVAIYLILIMLPQFLGGDTTEAIAGSVGRSISTSNGRLYFWQLILQNLAQQPLLGSGPGLSACIGPQTFFAHPHNFYIQLAGEWGVPAGLLAATAIIYVIQSVIRKLAGGLDSVNSTALISVSTGALAASIHAMFSGVMVMPASQVCCVLVMGYLTALLLKVTPAPSGNTAARTELSRNKPISVLAISLVALAVIQLGYFVVSELPQLESRSREYVEINSVRLSPRLWQHGNICSFPE